jgi:hypothetical protein
LNWHAAKNGGSIKLPVINTANDNLPETARATVVVSNFADKEFNLRTNLAGIARKPSLIASIGLIYEVIEAPLA